jgi:excinuclease ABC subunit B
MRYLIEETERRKKIQIEYNRVNKIKPETILKSLEDIKLTTSVADSAKKETVHSPNFDETTLEGMETKISLEDLNRKMLKCAKNLQFEEAALLRDKIRIIEESHTNL